MSTHGQEDLVDLEQQDILMSLDYDFSQYSNNLETLSNSGSCSSSSGQSCCEELHKKHIENGIEVGFHEYYANITQAERWLYVLRPLAFCFRVYISEVEMSIADICVIISFYDILLGQYRSRAPTPLRRCIMRM